MKFRTKKWGRIKISYELKKKLLKASDIEKGLESINKNQARFFNNAGKPTEYQINMEDGTKTNVVVH